MALGEHAVEGDWLAPGEQVLVKTKPHWKSSVRPLLAGLVVGLALAAAGFVHGQQGGVHKTHGLALIALGVVLFLVFLVAGLIGWLTTDYYVTDLRVATRFGALTRKGVDVPLVKVNSLRFRRGITDRIFGTGTLVITLGSFWPVKLTAVREAQKVHTTLYAALRGVGPSAPLSSPSVGAPHSAFPPLAGPWPSAAPASTPQPLVSPYAVPAPVAQAPAPAPQAAAPEQKPGPPVPPWAEDQSQWAQGPDGPIRVNL